MATYSINAPGGLIPFTGWSPTLGNGPANVGSATGAVQMNGVSQDDYRIIAPIGQQANKAWAALLSKLVGAATGQTATASNTRVQAVQGGQLNGLQTIEVVPLINRVTTANDVAAFTALFSRTTFPSTYPPDASGNGGGGHPWW